MRNDQATPSLLTRFRLPLVTGIVLSAIAGGAYEYFVAQAEVKRQSEVAEQRDVLRAQNDETWKKISSPEAIAAWAEEQRLINEQWEKDLLTLPASERAEEQFGDIAQLTRDSGVKLLAFERLGPNNKPLEPPAAKARPAQATSVSPGVETRRVHIKFLANSDQLRALISAIAAYPRPITIVQEDAIGLEAPVRERDVTYLMSVDLYLDVYFARRSAAALGEPGE